MDYQALIFLLTIVSVVLVAVGSTTYRKLKALNHKHHIFRYEDDVVFSVDGDEIDDE